MILANKLTLIWLVATALAVVPPTVWSFAPSAPLLRFQRGTFIQQHEGAKISCSATSRRKALGKGGAFVAGSILGDSFGQEGESNVANAATQKQEGLLADLLMVRLRLPKAALGREYVGLQLKINGKGPFDFMVDTGLTTEMISPHLEHLLGIEEGNTKIHGLGAGGSTSNSLVPLKGASVCCGKFPETEDELKLPELTAVVTDFPQEHIDPAHDVEGMLGMEALSLFDLDLDFPAGRIRLWRPGTAKQAAEKAGLVEIPAVVLNESGLYGIRVSAPGSQQPVVGIIDCGASFSAINWAAAGFLGLPGKTDAKAYANAPAVSAIGIDGRPMLLPTRKTQLNFAGDAQKDPATGAVSFEAPPSNWKIWDPVQLAIGDLPVFSDLLGGGADSPASLIGLDILSQRRVILETGATRQRRLWVSPK